MNNNTEKRESREREVRIRFAEIERMLKRIDNNFVYFKELAILRSSTKNRYYDETKKDLEELVFELNDLFYLFRQD